MSQQILDMIARMGGTDSVAAMASRVGLSPDQAQSAVAALVPMLAGGMAKQVQAGNGSVVDSVAGMAAAFTGSAASDQAVGQGTEILGQLFGSHDVTAAVAQNAAAKTGIDAGALAALLPMVATLAASALGNGSGTVAAPAQAGGMAGGLGGLLGGLLGGNSGGGTGAAGMLMGMLDTNKDGNPLDEIMGMASKMMRS